MPHIQFSTPQHFTISGAYWVVMQYVPLGLPAELHPHGLLRIRAKQYFACIGAICQMAIIDDLQNAHERSLFVIGIVVGSQEHRVSFGC